MIKHIGVGTYFAEPPKVRENLTNVTFGNYCCIAHNLLLDCGFQHNLNNLSIYPFNKVFTQECGHITNHPISKGDIVIKNDVWIGENVTIMSGVTIGNGAIIGTGSVVTTDVKDYYIVGGVPAKFIKQRFPDNIISELLNIGWWNWEESLIRKFSPILMSGDINSLINIAKNLRK